MNQPLEINAVTAMTVEQQQKEADCIRERIFLLRKELDELEQIHSKRLRWITAKKRLSNESFS